MLTNDWAIAEGSQLLVITNNLNPANCLIALPPSWQCHISIVSSTSHVNTKYHHVKSCGNIDSQKTLAIDMQNTAWHHTYTCKNEVTSQNTMYCGGELREEIHAHNNDKHMFHEPSSLAVRLFTNHRC